MKSDILNDEVSKPNLIFSEKTSQKFYLLPHEVQQQIVRLLVRGQYLEAKSIYDGCAEEIDFDSISLM